MKSIQHFNNIKLILGLLISSALITFVLSKCALCPDYPRLYRELGCKPVKTNSQRCAASYTCPNLYAVSKTKCYYKGKAYAIGDHISNADSPPCDNHCICGQRSQGYARFNCPIIDCIRPTEGCVFQQNFKQCCAPTKICGEEATELPKCYVDNKEYVQGDKFVPQNSCYNCICDKNFSNSTNYRFNKNCQPINCGVEIRARDQFEYGCAPVYLDSPTSTECCPFSYSCPSPTDQVIPPSPLPPNYGSSHATCVFGNLTFQISDRLTKYDKCVDCVCKVPPMLECTQKPGCD